MHASRFKLLLHIFIDRRWLRSRIDLDHSALLLKVLHHRHTLLDERLESLLDGLLIIIGAPTSLAAVEQPLTHRLLGAIEEQGKLALHHHLLEFLRLVHLTGKAIDEELAVAVLFYCGIHGVLEELDCDFHGHDLALFDVGLDHVAELAAGSVLLFSEQIAGGEVLECVVPHQIGALCSFSCAWTAEHEDDERLAVACAWGEEWLAAFGRGEGWIVLHVLWYDWHLCCSYRAPA